jgi:hypothetical protein
VACRSRIINCATVCPDESAVLLDLYETPVKVDIRELELAAQQRWQEQMNAWLVEHEELNRIDDPGRSNICV